jgi:hypothetical protein
MRAKAMSQHSRRSGFVQQDKYPGAFADLLMGEM